LGIKLALTSAYNPEANGKSEHKHGPIVIALVKSCDGKENDWPKLLSFTLWADRTIHSTITRYMPAKLMCGQKPVMPIEEVLLT
jgi:hypothetical protein